MHTTVRIYRGAPGLADALAAKTNEISDLLKKVDGFQAYQCIKTADGAVSGTTCRDQSGTEESNRVAAEYLRNNMPSIAPAPPEVLNGEAVVKFGLEAARA